MPRSSTPQKHRRPQKSKGKKREYKIFPIVTSDKHFEKGDKDGGYDNWIPADKGMNNPPATSEILNTSDASVLIPKQKKKERY